MAQARRVSSVRRGSRRRGRGWNWLGLGLGLAVLVYIARAPIERVAHEANMELGYRRVEGRAELLRATAADSGVEANLLAAIMLAESSGRVDAVSSAGALGLFQLMLPTARERAQKLGLPEPSREDLLRDAQLNARLAGDYLSWLARRYDFEPERMLVAYNAGPARLDGWIRDAGSYARWRADRLGRSAVLAYAAKVLRYRERFAERGVIVPPAAATQPPVLASEVAPGAELFGPPVPDAVHVDPADSSPPVPSPPR